MIIGMIMVRVTVMSGDKGGDRHSFMSAGKGVSRVDVGITIEAERCGISIAHDGSRGILADLADEDTLMPGSELIGCVDARIAGHA